MRFSSKSSRILRISLAFIIIALLLFLILKPKTIEVQTSLVKRGTYIESITSEGILRSKDRFIVPAFATGEIDRVDLKVGDPLKKDQTITTLLWDVESDPVKAPISGVVSKIYRESAGPILRGEPIIEIVDPSRLEGVAEVLTIDASKIKPGDKATIEGWGGTTPLHATVKRISKAGFVKISALGVEEEKTEVTLELEALSTQILKQLGNTYHVDIVIEIGRMENALLIPMGALFREGANWSVYRSQNKHAIRTPIQIKGSSSGVTAVEQGLNEGEEVIVYPGDLVKDGAKIKTKPF